MLLMSSVLSELQQPSIMLAAPDTAGKKRALWASALITSLYTSTSIPSLDTRNRIAFISTLPNGWAGDNSTRIDPSVISRSISALERIALVGTLADPEITPNPNGTISFEWESPRIAIYLEIGKTKVSGFLQGALTGSLPISFTELPIELFKGFSEFLSPSVGASFTSDKA